MKILVNEHQLQNVITPYHLKHGILENKRMSLVKENWKSVPYKDKKLIIEVYKVLHPENEKRIDEARWWNTIGDIVGIFDPTGVVDIVNGLDYFRQGDRLFGLLSLISAVPYVGDLVGKPIIGMMKLGGEGAKILRQAKNSTEFAAAAKHIPQFGKLLNKFGQIGPKLFEMLQKLTSKIPGLKGMMTTLEEWIKMFTQAAKEYKLPTQQVMKNGKPLFRGGMKGAERILRPVEKVDFLKSISQILKPGSEGLKTFRNYKALNPSLWTKYGIGGVGRIWGNRATRALMRKTKWYLAFLDFIGVKNFVGPDELDAQLGQDQVVQKMNDFSQSEESTNVWNEEMGNMEEPTPQTNTGGGFDLGSMFGGSVAPETMNLLQMMAK
jgi:hypothetical protein